MNRIIKRLVCLGGMLLVTGTAPAAIRHAGLIQGYFDCPSGKEPVYVFDLLDNIATNLLDYTVSTDMANFRGASNGASLTNPLSGIAWTWNYYQTFGYQGRMWMEEGVPYTVYSRCDDGACVFFDGTKVSSPGNVTGNGSAKCETYTPAASGWVDFYAYTWDWTGAKGPVADNLWGLAYNTNGVMNTDKLVKGTEPWMVFQDSGNCETLFYELPESWLTVLDYGESSSEYSVDLSVTLPEDAVDCEAMLLYDEEDRGDHRISDWSNRVSRPISGGTQTVALTFPVPADGQRPTIRAVVKGKESNGIDFIEYSLPFKIESNPSAELAPSSIAHNSASFTISLTALGAGAKSVSLKLTVWTDVGLTEEERTVALAEVLDQPQVFSYKLDGLHPATAYWVTVRAVNDLGHEAISSAVSFETLKPLPGTFQYCGILQRGFADAECQFGLSDYGAGSVSMEFTLELSKTSDFVDILEFPAGTVSGVLPQRFTAKADGLEPGKTYWGRGKALNSCGLAFYSEVFAFTTHSQPYVASEISAVRAEGGSDISVTLSDILDGVTGSVTLAVDGRVVQTWTLEAANGVFRCPAFVAIESGTQARVVYSVDCEFEGSPYSATVEAEISGGVNRYVAGDLSDCRDFYPQAGETVVLPEISNAFGSYFVANETVGELQPDGRTVRVLKGGGTAIVYHETDPFGSTNIVVSSVPLVAPPVPAGEGKVFLWTEKNYLWRDPANWICLNDDSLTGVDYPHNVDDVAMIFQRNGKENSNSLSFGSDENAPDIILGEIYKGSLNSYLVNEGNIELARNDNGPVTNVLRFAKSDGSVPRIVFSSSQIKNRNAWFTIGRGPDSVRHAERLLCDLSQGLVIDGGFGNAASNEMRRVLLRFGNADVILPEGKELRITNMNDVKTSANGKTVEFSAGCTISGGGRIVHDAPSYANLSAELERFTGTYVESTYHPKYGFDRIYGTFLWATNVANATLEIAGWLDTVQFGHFSEEAGMMRGFAGRGINHSYGSTNANPGNVLGYKNVVLKGGLLSLKAEGRGDWADKLIVNRPAEMTVERGVSAMYFLRQTNTSYPTNALTVPKLTQHNGAVLYLNEENSISYGKTPAEVRQHIRFDNFAEHAIGEPGDPTSADSGEVFPIIPWLLTKGNWCNSLTSSHRGGMSTYFVSVNDENEVISPYRTQTALADATPNQNVSCWGKAFALTEDKTINSLYKGTSGGPYRDLGEGRTLTVTSGGVILSRYGSIGSEATCGAASGRLNFPNRAYVTFVYDDTDDLMRGVWAPMTSPNGCSLSNLSDKDVYIGGDQTGIDGDLTVNRGSLVLGTAETPARLDCAVNLVGKKTKLTVVSSENFDPMATVLNFVDIMDENATIQLDADVSVKMLQIDGESLPRGQYSAANLPTRLTGDGILTVRLDNERRGTMLLLK